MEADLLIMETTVNSNMAIPLLCCISRGIVNQNLKCCCVHASLLPLHNVSFWTHLTAQDLCGKNVAASTDIIAFARCLLSGSLQEQRRLQ